MTAALSHKAVSVGRQGAEDSPFWQAHDAELRLCAEQGMMAAEVAERIGATYCAVKSRSQRIGVRWHGYRSAASAFWLSHDADLRRYAKEGLSTTQAAKLLGVTKNAVIGRAGRIGVVWARTPTPRSKPMQREWEYPPTGRCVYPQGHPRESGFSFCGEPTCRTLSDEPSPYCHDHHRLTHIPIDRTEPRPMTWIVRREQDIGRQWGAAAE